MTAVNKGGESFPSEILSSHRVAEERGRVLVVNGFNRVSAPLSIQGDSLAGFYNFYDSGVAYLKNIDFTGEQRNFDRRLSRSENDNNALGSSYSDYETEVIAGNTFDYPAMHGASIAEAGFSYCSASTKAVENGVVELNEYPIIDYILGKQRSCEVGRGAGVCEVDYKVFSDEMQELLRAYTRQGGALFVSGCYVVSDLWNGIDADGEDREFARNVLHAAFNGDMATRRGVAKSVASPMNMKPMAVNFNREPSAECYGVESPGCIAPAGRGTYIAMRYATNNQVAAVAYNGTDYRTMIMGFPFEAILDVEQRNQLMQGILEYLNAKKEKK
ncbi:MAG: hypothetical protein II216_03210 [Alistipes sp.]|nr:hypothetical protein [Alistipes sp.]